MKVTRWVDFGQDIEIEIGAEDVKMALAESFAKVGEDRRFRDLGGEDRASPHHILDSINCIGRFFLSLTDDEISVLNDAQRKTIAEFLDKAAKRFVSQP